MEVENQEYVLSQAIASHKQGVRCVDVNKNMIISGSTDKTVKVYQLVGDKYDMIADVNFFDDYILAVAINRFGEGFFAACKDKQVYQLDVHGSPSQTLIGHTGPVCSISQIDEHTLVTGSWDETARVWDLREGKEIRKIEGHKHAVTVLGVAHLDLLVTGSQDKNLNFWRLSTGQLINSVKEAHADIIRQIAFVEDVGFLSASNDEKLKLWTFDGDLISDITGHQSFVYSCASISFGKYVSVSEDQSLKVWNDTSNLQTILHPGTVWSVAVNAGNHDIVTGCADGSLRIFTTDPTRKAPPIDIEDFERSAQLSNAKGPQGLPAEELAKMPDVSDLSKFVGKKDGELKIFKNGGVPEAYVWKQADQVWDKIGEVVSSIPKKSYAGDKYFAAGDYDYIFDVDDESGFTKSIPFNDGDNPMEAAEKYCARENIGRGNMEQIRKFLMQNTKGSGAAKPSGQSSSGSNPSSSQAAFSSEYFPMNQFQYFEQMNLEGLKKKLIEFNELLISQNHSLTLNEKMVYYLNAMISMLEKRNTYHMTLLNTNELEVFTTRLINWPLAQMMPVFDLFRIFAIHPQSDSLFAGVDSGLHYFTIICGGLMSDQLSDVIKNVIVRILCNLFNQTSARFAFFKYHKFIVDCIRTLRNNGNANVKISLATFLYNISAEYVNNQNHNVESIIAYTHEIVELLAIETNTDNILKYLIAAGNLALKSPTAAKPIIRTAIQKYQLQANDAKLNKCLSDLKRIL